MRRLILFVLLAFFGLRLHAAERMTVQQLEEMLAAHAAEPAASGEQPDLLAQIAREDDLAPRIGDIELTERLTPATRQHLITAYKLGPLTQEALRLLADRSALLDPPSGEIPALPPPDMAAQRAMIHAAGNFVYQTLAHLPNFFAVRVTTHFDDAPVVINGMLLNSAPGLHRVATYSREITYRDGREIMTSLQQDSNRQALWNQGLQTQGEFGPEPAIVFLDITHGKLAFDHWEKTEDGMVAVYRYSVPAESSHYQVAATCRVTRTFQKNPAYHGLLTLDPNSGVLHRITLQTEAAPDDPLTGVASVIEYGPVEIGNRSYVCPLRSLAFSTQQVSACSAKLHEKKLARPIVYLNRTVFTTYHRLGSDHTIVAAPVTQAGSNLPPEPQQNPDTPRP